MSKARPLAAPPRDPSRPRSKAAPSDGSEDNSRERIHLSALKLFSRYGYDGVSLQMIADDVGLHKSSLFHHYTGKLELMREAVLSVIAELLALLEPLLEQEEPTLQTLYDGMMLLVDHFSEHPESARLLVTIMTAPDGSDVAKLARDEQSAGFYMRLSRWLEHARRLGVVRKISIRQAIPNIMGLILFYPAVANDLRDFVGPDAFSARARQVRREEITRLLQAMFAP
ncbi:MAG TPA: TetR/AcrR family transcriptional regulator [Polyangiaceae bacterium]|nr:TetR/AcrR family transcriptional regulator [Polyangiaceae bacterium]